MTTLAWETFNAEGEGRLFLPGEFSLKKREAETTLQNDLNKLTYKSGPL